MTLRRLVMAIAAIAMLGAIAASDAGANNVTDPARWYVNGTGLNAGQTANVKCSVGNHNGEGAKLVLHGFVGEVEQLSITITATGIECINHEGTPGANGTTQIVQTGKGTVGEPYVAEDLGRLKLTGVTVSQPSGCTVSGGTITTNPLKSQLLMDSENTAITFDKFEPTGTNFATVKIEGASCAIAGSRVVKGCFVGQAENLTGIEAVNQPLTFGESVEKTFGSKDDSCELVFASNPAHLTGTVNNELTGANAGLKWGAKNG